MSWDEYHNLAYWSDDADEATDEGHEGTAFLAIEHETERAFLFRFLRHSAWIPKSQIHHLDREKRIVVVSQWLLREVRR